jgi:hypothetical protein
MSTLLARLLKPLSPNPTVTGSVLSLTDTGAIVRTKTGTREVNAAANVSYSVGDTVKLQGDILVSRQNTPTNLTTYQV